jgi:uncharacterized protein YjiS (DUF1127 family)
MTCTTTRTHFVRSDNNRTASTRSARVLGSRLRSFFHMMARQKWRRALLQLDDHLLKDIGITRERALSEASKWFWQD